MDFDFGHSFGLPFALSPFARLIPTFAGSQYGTIDTAITFTGDFEVEAQFSTTADTVAIFGKSTDDASLCFLTGAGLLQARFANVTGINSTTVVNDGKIHTALMRRVGTTNTLFIDGVQENTNTQAVVNAVFDLIGTSSGSLLFNGEILAVKFTDNSGTPVVTNFVFDSGSTTDQPSRGGGNNVTLVNFATTDWFRYTLQRNITHDAGVISEAWVGDNLVVNGGFDADTDWIKGTGWTIGSGVASKAVSAGGSITQDILTDGVPYLLIWDVPRIDAGYTIGYIGLGTFSAALTTTGTKRFFGKCATDTKVYIFGNLATDVDVDNVSAQHILEVA